MTTTLKYKPLLRYIVLLLFVMFSQVTIAQQNNPQLAFEYFRNQEYEKASIVFYELYQEKENNYYRNYYVQCLIQLDKLEEANKFVKKALRKNKNDIDLRIDQAFITEKLGNEKKAQSLYNEIIEDYAVMPNSAKTLANGFTRKRKFELAEQVYLKAIETSNNESLYYNLANLYSIQRKFENMIDTYLKLLEFNSTYINSIQTRLTSLTNVDVDGSLNTILENALLKKIQSNNSNPVFTELLIWQLIQTGKYEMAIQHANALDKRFNEQGKRLFELGKIAAANKKNDIAQLCFEKVYKYGKSSQWYFQARFIELDYQYNKAINKIDTDSTELQELKNLISNTCNEAPFRYKHPLKVLLIKLQAYYLNQSEIALATIDSLMSNKRLPRGEQIDLMLLQGDIFLVNDNPWDATLVYAKIEQENKENPIGVEAKFRKAKLAYYTGQFDWAKAQLDALKASTSKLISNDALELSLFISENLAEDSLQTALEMFSRSDLLFLKQRYGLAYNVLDSIKNQFPKSDLIDDVLFRQAKIKETIGDYTEAIDLYNLVVTNHSWERLADNALISIARIQENKLENKKAAIETYKQLLINFKGSIFAEEARNSIQSINFFENKHPNEEQQ